MIVLLWVGSNWWGLMLVMWGSWGCLLLMMCLLAVLRIGWGWRCYFPIFGILPILQYVQTINNAHWTINKHCNSDQWSQFSNSYWNNHAFLIKPSPVIYRPNLEAPLHKNNAKLSRSFLTSYGNIFKIVISSLLILI